MMEGIDYSRFKIVLFEECHYRQLQDLIKTGWNPNHVLLKSDSLFRWHYEGFGEKAGVRFPLLFDGDRLIGYRMMTPIEMMLSDEWGNHKVVPLAASSLYFVESAYRGMKLGVKLENHVIDYYGGYFTIAANPVTAVPILKRSGCKMIDTMLRHFRPLKNDISPIIVGPCEHKWESVRAKVINPCEIDAETLARIWAASIDGKNVTALNRSQAFWQWRYLDDPVYKYHFFRDQNGLVVARVCDIFNGRNMRTGLKVLRVLEVIPTQQDVWDGRRSEGLSSLIDGVCGWGKAQGCMAAEFYTSTHRFDAVMADAHFEEINLSEPLCGCVMSYFEPESDSHRLSNVGILSSLVPDDFNFYNSYFTLSDADQDRPNIL